MNEFYAEAKKKLADGLKAKMDRYGEAMKRSVHDALLEFCRQDGEFAQAVAQGGSFTDCMKAVAKKVKNNALPDTEAWAEAVRFYFPGADIDVKMTINLCASVEGGDSEPKKAGMLVDLSDFFN